MKTWQLLKKNPHLLPRYYVKEYITKACRKFFEHRNYHELESPILASALPQERYLDVLTTNIEQKNDIPKTAYIVPTTETYNKKVLAAGLGEHFVITKVARGLEEIGPNHSPEFTMLEWYHLHADYTAIMSDCEELLIFIFKYLNIALNTDKRFLAKAFELSFDEINQIEVDYKFDYQNTKISLEPSWERLAIPEALEKYAKVKLEEIQDIEDFRKIAQQKGYNVDASDDWQIIFELIFANEIEPKLSTKKPTFVYDYPKQLCPLTQTSKSNQLVCEKVELYFAGKEVANGYTELIDWREQEKRFLEEQEARRKLGKTPIKMDYDLIGALRAGLPPVAGIGMGLDRIAMIFANTKTIAEINYFPASEMFED